MEQDEIPVMMISSKIRSSNAETINVLLRVIIS